MDSRIGRESRCPYNGFEAPFDESIKAGKKKRRFQIQNKGQKFQRSTAGLTQERKDTCEGREMVGKKQ